MADNTGVIEDNAEVIEVWDSDMEFTPPPLRAVADRDWAVSDETPKVVICIVCAHSDFDKRYVKLGNCAHVMHETCIPSSDECPLCRQEIGTPTEVLLCVEDIPKPQTVDQRDTGVQTEVQKKDQATQTKARAGKSQRHLLSYRKFQYEAMKKMYTSRKKKVGRVDISQFMSDASWSSDDDFVEKKPK